jgi:hypothetical protein
MTFKYHLHHALVVSKLFKLTGIVGSSVIFVQPQNFIITIAKVGVAGDSLIVESIRNAEPAVGTSVQYAVPATVIKQFQFGCS